MGAYGGKALEVIAISLIPSLGAVINLLTVAIGLGLVIFFHELGHFAVAKWCGVNVERFSIGFGTILWSFKRGETEYALSMIPFGGYVKMLGQDDADPSQMTSEEITSDPRSYPAKSVPQRMAIISAGVIMNLITGMMFFAVAFMLGVQVQVNVIKSTQPGMPAWEYGIRDGDTITEINGSRVDDYADIRINTALSRGDMTIKGTRADGEPFQVTLTPDASGIHRRIGVLAADSLQVYYIEQMPDLPYLIPDSVADRLSNGFQRGDTVVAVDGVEVSTMAQLMDHLALHRDESVEFSVAALGDQESSSTRTVTVPPQPFLELGLTFSNGKVTALRHESPATTPDAEGDIIQVGDRIVKVDGQLVGTDIDPFALPDYFGDRAGQEVVVTVAREQGGGPPEELEMRLTPEDRVGWTEPPIFEDSPLSIPSIGVAFQVLPTVFAVEEGGPAAQAGIKPRETVVSIQFKLPDGVEETELMQDVDVLEIGANGIPHAFWSIQNYAAWNVILKVKSADSDDIREVAIKPRASSDWNVPLTRGLLFTPSLLDQKSDTVLGAMAMGLDYTGDSVAQIYLTLRSLFTGDLSIKGLSGPIGIANIAWQMAQQGFSDFLLFLGLISINLAVINFLPIPVLDGGHMVFLIWEGVTRRKPSEAVFRWATNLGLLFVMGLLITVIFLDLFVSKV